MNSSVHQRRLLLTALAGVLATPLLIIGAIRTMDGIHTSALAWLDPSTPERQRYELFTERFEGGSFVLLSWEGCVLGDPRLEKLEQALAKHTGQEKGEAPPLIDKVLSGRTLYEDLKRAELKLTDQQARDRLAGSFIGPDGQTTCLVVVLSEHGARQRSESLPLLKETALEAAELTEEELHFAGPTVDALAVDIESDRSVDYYAGPSVLVSFLLCLWCLNSVRYSAAIMAVAGFGELMVLGSLHYFGVTMDAVLIVLPPLVFVLTVSSGIHLVNYYYDQVRVGAGDNAPRMAVLHGWLPCSLAALTTAIGLGSLLVSRIVPVNTFGKFAAGGVVICVLLLFFTLPGVMCRWPISRRSIRTGEATSTLVVMLMRMADAVGRHASLITAAGIAILIAGGIGLTHLRTSIGVNALFPSHSKVVKDFEWTEQNVARLVPLEVVLAFPNDDGLRMVDRLTLTKQVEDAIRGIDKVGGVTSVATFSPEIPRGRGSRVRVARGMVNAELENNKQRLIDSRYLAETPTTQLWRISARVPGSLELDYEVVLKELRDTVEPVLDGIQERFDTRPTASYTGTMPVVFRAQHALLADMYTSMVLAFVLVWLVMSAVLMDFSGGLSQAPSALAKAFWLGALAMLPNVFPIVVVFGLMGWLGWDADIGSTMTACVALGIAVDDTLHFLAWYRRETAKGDPPMLAIRHSFQHCGRAMIQTTLICGLGMLVFGLSGFMPTKRFSLLMFTLLNAALVADLIFLPAILASPLGRLFDLRPSEHPAL